jgi:hypothetical protein
MVVESAAAVVVTEGTAEKEKEERVLVEKRKGEE